MVRNRIFASIIICMLGTTGVPADDSKRPVAHWKLTSDAKDAANRFETRSHGVRFIGKGPDGQTPTAVFDGRSCYLEVQPNAQLNPGTGDFTFALWLRSDDRDHSDPGDLVSLYDETKRVGLNLSLRTNAATTGTANVRQLQFGIDAGSQPRWTDEGRPGTAILAFALAVHNGHLYAGTADNGAGKTGRVYRYAKTGEWTDCGAPDLCNTVTALTTFNGQLYAGTGKYRFSGSALLASDNPNRGGGVFRYEGGTRWTEVGRLPEVDSLASLCVFRGQLYASSLYKPAGFFRYESEGKWTALPVPEGKRVESLAVFQDAIWASSYDDGRVYRYDGTRWEDLGRLGENTQTYAFTVYRNQLCVSTWPSGKVYRRTDNQWEDLGQLGNEQEVMGMLVHNGALYGGTLPLAAVFRYDGAKIWTKTADLDETPNVKYRRVWTMAAYDGRLFCSTLPSGKIFSLETGPCVTSDRELPMGWQHIAAVKQGGNLRLFVNGKPVAQSRPFDPAQFNLTVATPLRIGAGSGSHFHGSLTDVRLYHRALSEKELGVLSHR